MTEVHWRIIANLGFKLRSQFTAHCGRRVACGRRAARRAACMPADHLAPCWPVLGSLVIIFSWLWLTTVDKADLPLRQLLSAFKYFTSYRIGSLFTGLLGICDKRLEQMVTTRIHNATRFTYTTGVNRLADNMVPLSAIQVISPEKKLS